MPLDFNIKTCPFCDHPSELKLDELSSKYYVCCSARIDDCPVHPCTDTFEEMDDAIAAWNTRFFEIPTCTNVSLKAHKGVFCCSECNLHVDIALMDSTDDYLPNFCPECGKKVT